MPDSAYSSVLSREAVAFVVSLPKRKQIKVLDLADRIALSPEMISDVTQYDSVGRPIQSVLIDGFLFNYWIDHTSRDVRMTEIHEV